MSKENRLIKEDFCRLKGLPFVMIINVDYQERNTKTGNAVFVMSGPLLPAVRYEQERIDLTPYSLHKSLQLEKEFQTNTAAINKDGIAAWFNRWTRLGLLPTDIGQLLIKTNSVTVVSSSNSMRFKHSFSMSFK